MSTAQADAAVAVGWCDGSATPPPLGPARRHAARPARTASGPTAPRGTRCSPTAARHAARPARRDAVPPGRRGRALGRRGDARPASATSPGGSTLPRAGDGELPPRGRDRRRRSADPARRHRVRHRHPSDRPVAADVRMRVATLAAEHQAPARSTAPTELHARHRRQPVLRHRGALGRARRRFRTPCATPCSPGWPASTRPASGRWSWSPSPALAAEAELVGDLLTHGLSVARRAARTRAAAPGRATTWSSATSSPGWRWLERGPGRPRGAHPPAAARGARPSVAPTRPGLPTTPRRPATSAAVLDLAPPRPPRGRRAGRPPGGRAAVPTAPCATPTGCRPTSGPSCCGTWATSATSPTGSTRRSRPSGGPGDLGTRSATSLRVGDAWRCQSRLHWFAGRNDAAREQRRPGGRAPRRHRHGRAGHGAEPPRRAGDARLQLAGDARLGPSAPSTCSTGCRTAPARGGAGPRAQQPRHHRDHRRRPRHGPADARPSPSSGARSANLAGARRSRLLQPLAPRAVAQRRHAEAERWLDEGIDVLHRPRPRLVDVYLRRLALTAAPRPRRGGRGPGGRRDGAARRDRSAVGSLEPLLVLAQLDARAGDPAAPATPSPGRREMADGMEETAARRARRRRPAARRPGSPVTTTTSRRSRVAAWPIASTRRLPVEPRRIATWLPPTSKPAGRWRRRTPRSGRGAGPRRPQRWERAGLPVRTGSGPGPQRRSGRCSPRRCGIFDRLGATRPPPERGRLLRRWAWRCREVPREQPPGGPDPTGGGGPGAAGRRAVATPDRRAARDLAAYRRAPRRRDPRQARRP